MKKRLLLFLLPILLFSCSSRSSGVHLILYNREDPYVDVFATQIEEEALGRFPLEIHDSRNSQLVQNTILEDLLKENPALIILNPVDRLASYAIIDKLKSRGIPVIFFNREPLKQDMERWDQAYYVGARAEQSARMQADLAIDLFERNRIHSGNLDRNSDGIIQAVILKGEQGHQDAEARTVTVIQAFEEASVPLEVLSVEIANWKSSEAFDKADMILEKYGDSMELVLSNNDAMAIGFINRLRQKGWFAREKGSGILFQYDTQWLPVLGIDGLQNALDMILEGYLYGTVINDSQSMAEAIAQLSERLLLEQNLEGMTYPLQQDQYIWIDYKPYIFE